MSQPSVTDLSSVKTGNGRKQRVRLFRKSLAKKQSYQNINRSVLSLEALTGRVLFLDLSGVKIVVGSCFYAKIC